MNSIFLIGLWANWYKETHQQKLKATASTKNILGLFERKGKGTQSLENSPFESIFN